MVNDERRSFLRWGIHALGAVFATVLGVPALAYLADARNRPAPQRGLRTVHGINLNELEVGVPKQGVIRDVFRDAWTLSEDVVGRVWVIKSPQGIKTFTTICPHLGCSINLDPPGPNGAIPGFTCPCHGGKFNLDGTLNTQVGQNPAPRGMDELESHSDPANPNVLQVVYKNFYQGRHEKVPKA